MCVVCGGPVAPGLSFLLMASSRRCFLGRHPMQASQGRRNSFTLSGTHSAKPNGGQVYELTPHLAISSPFPPPPPSPLNPLPLLSPLPSPPLLPQTPAVVGFSVAGLLTSHKCIQGRCQGDITEKGASNMEFPPPVSCCLVHVTVTLVYQQPCS